MISIATKRLFYFDEDMRQKKINNRRKINYTYEMHRVCRNNRFQFKFYKLNDIGFTKKCKYIFIIIDSKNNIFFEENYEIEESFTLNNNLELVLKDEKHSEKKNLQKKRKMNILQLFSKLFLLNYFS